MSINPIHQQKLLDYCQLFGTAARFFLFFQIQEFCGHQLPVNQISLITKQLLSQILHEMPLFPLLSSFLLVFFLKKECCNKWKKVLKLKPISANCYEVIVCQWRKDIQCLTWPALHLDYWARFFYLCSLALSSEVWRSVKNQGKHTQFKSTLNYGF